MSDYATEAELIIIADLQGELTPGAFKRNRHATRNNMISRFTARLMKDTMLSDNLAEEIVTEIIDGSIAWRFNH